MLTHEQNIRLHHAIADQLLERLEFAQFQPDSILDFGGIDRYLLNKLAIVYPDAKLFACGLELLLADHSCDLIISNLAINYLDPCIDKLFKKLHKIIRPEGLLLFTMLNDNYNADTLNNNILLSMGDMLLLNKFCDPVMDRELININYKTNIEIIYGHALGNSLITDLTIPVTIDD